jgi:hypothetical protein
MASTLNISIDQGADFIRLLTFKDESDAAINLTGYTFRGQARTKYGAETEVFSFVFALRNQTTNTGEVDWTLPDTATSSLALKQATEYVYDVERVSPDGTVTRILEGVATVRPEATK